MRVYSATLIQLDDPGPLTVTIAITNPLRGRDEINDVGYHFEVGNSPWPGSPEFKVTEAKACALYVASLLTRVPKNDRYLPVLMNGVRLIRLKGHDPVDAAAD